MTPGNPLDTEPTSATARPRPDQFAGAAVVAPAEAPAPLEHVQWVEMAAGRAVQVDHTELPARRPIELDLIERREDLEVEAEARALADHEPSHMYRSAYAVVMAVVVSFFVSGAGMCAYVLVRH
jgi:hypothetical protein